ncbi:hypothetical protein H0H93_008241 [Arthromyces matolae]|nr:hypothetical protein H0H93_008241 [Arthromyces matolae]
MQYLYNLARDDPQAPRIPQIIDYFPASVDGMDIEILVMEYISPPVVTIGKWINSGHDDTECQRRADVAAEKIAEIISWLYNCPLPLNPPVGPIGGGIICHRFFMDAKSPMPFANVAALEIYINKVLSFDRKKRGIEHLPQTVELCDLPLQFCHCDISFENFLIHPETLDVWLVDGQDISILPAPFATYALTYEASCILSAVASRVGLFPWPKMNIFRRAAYLVKASCLDSHGRQKSVDSVKEGPQRFAPPPRPLDSKYSHIRVVEIPTGEEKLKYLPSSDPFQYVPRY